jgi:hypothetical protein
MPILLSQGVFWTRSNVVISGVSKSPAIPHPEGGESGIATRSWTVTNDCLWPPVVLPALLWKTTLPRSYTFYSPDQSLIGISAEG